MNKVKTFMHDVNGLDAVTYQSNKKKLKADEKFEARDKEIEEFIKDKKIISMNVTSHMISYAGAGVTAYLATTIVYEE